MTIFIVSVFFHYRGCFFIIVGAFSKEGGMLIGAQIIIFQIDNLTPFLTSGVYRAYKSTIKGKFICWVFQYNDCGENL